MISRHVSPVTQVLVDCIFFWKRQKFCPFANTSQKVLQVRESHRWVRYTNNFIRCTTPFFSPNIKFAVDGSHITRGRPLPACQPVTTPSDNRLRRLSNSQDPPTSWVLTILPRTDTLTPRVLHQAEARPALTAATKGVLGFKVSWACAAPAGVPTWPFHTLPITTQNTFGMR